mmetsp:Transcript_5903/g.13738  ORF Transcript_5903/g.13738 Transcript_5903/m.13738 type:complete len:176 (-) Transcript_5903:384-911(-)
MTRLLSTFGKAASFTIRGAAVTFGSTVFSCVVACKIEKSANRIIYKYYPHKFANVEAASGITQEELDFIKYYYGGGDPADQVTQEPASSTANKPIETIEPKSQFRCTFDNVSAQSHEPNSQTPIIYSKATNEPEEEQNSTINKFWTEGGDAAAKALSIIPIIVPSQEILACSMTA